MLRTRQTKVSMEMPLELTRRLGWTKYRLLIVLEHKHLKLGLLELSPSSGVTPIIKQDF